jgi:superfamily II DNA or RNA helicase
LEEKTALGLAVPPDEKLPSEMLSERELLEQALADRMERARTEKFRLKSSDPEKPWADYTIASALSGKSYRVALRGENRGDSFCSCPDFRTNTLGTCKHILHVLHRVKRRFPAPTRRKPYRNREAFVHVLYGEELTLHLQLPDRPDPELAKAVGSLAKGPIDDVRRLVNGIKQLERQGQTITVYPDAEELIQRQLFELHMTERMAEIREAPAKHPLRKELLKVELLPYQLEGIAFVAGKGRAVLADDMGLGKTIQGVGVAEMLAREAGIGRVLVVCPASVKSQWRNEVHRFSDRTVQLVTGTAAQRAEQYGNDSFFTVCNYEQVLRDILAIERVRWDLIILDEGQRIKNWESKTARIIKGLKSTFALVLSGTPLENRLDELYSVVQFVDDRRLPPAFRFFHRHRIVDERGKVLGYKNLDQLRENLRPILLRRTRDSVLQQLPPRTNEIVRIPPTDEQLAMHSSYMQIVTMIARKAFISEMDLLRLQKALLMCRMSADSTFLVDKQRPGYSSKLEYLGELFDGLFSEPDRKVLLFSEWTNMLNQIEPAMRQRKIDFVRLDGSVPQKKRQELVNRFQNDPQCRMFITTNAGSTGLNLQAANTVINVDLPWNPAVLEQRIGRAHRMGQKQPVQVYVLVTEETIEESLLNTLSAKHDLALAALDAESEVSQVDFQSGVEELRRRLEVLLGAKPEAPVDVTKQEEVLLQTEQIVDHRDRVAAAGGEMLGAVFHFLGELVSQEQTQQPAEPIVEQVRNRLNECVEEDASGRQRLTVTLPDRRSLDTLAQTLARLMLAGNTDQVRENVP